MVNSNVEAVRRLFDRFTEGGIEAALESIHEDVLIEIPADMSAEPDIYRGHDGARRYFAGFEGMIESVRYEPIAVEPLGDKVIAHTKLSGRGVSSGLNVAIEAFVLHDFADGKVVRMRPYADLESAEAALD